MSTNLKTRLSKKSKYYISPNRYKELVYFCQQYPEWKEEIKEIGIRSRKFPGLKNRNYFSDSTANQAIFLSTLTKKIKLVEETVAEADPDISEFLLIAVTQDYTYDTLRTIKNVPCSRTYFYDRRRKFFWLLDNKKRHQGH